MRIYNLVRAVTEPYPGAFTHLPEGEKLFVWWGLPEKGSIANGPAGALEFEKDDVYVRASDGRLKLVDIEVEGENEGPGDSSNFLRNGRESS